MQTSNYKLYIFDLDKTLVDFDSDVLLPGVKEWFENRPVDCELAIASNQGGAGLRHWMESGGFGDPEALPTEQDVWARLSKITGLLGRKIGVYVCFAYHSKKSGQWGPTPIDCDHMPQWDQHGRKPDTGMLVRAMFDANVEPSETLMVGDSAEDHEAAERAGCDFMWAHEFFGRAL